MSVVHFDSIAAGLKSNFNESADGQIVTDALLMVEGTHTDNKGVSHKIPAIRINTIATNTNADFHKGVEIPFMVEHSRQIIGSDGQVKKLGKLVSEISCRPIQSDDLPDPRMTDLIGKLGAFGKVQVVNKLAEVKNRTIRLLSPGIDPIKNKFVEISAVAFPAIRGASLLFSRNINFASHGITDYDRAKKQIEAWSKPYQELLKKFEIFAGTIQAIETEQQEDNIAFNAQALKRKALEQYTEDLMNYLNISLDDSEEPEDIYETNPYAPQVINNNSGFNQKPDTVINFSKRSKRKRRGAS